MCIVIYFLHNAIKGFRQKANIESHLTKKTGTVVLNNIHL